MIHIQTGNQCDVVYDYDVDHNHDIIAFKNLGLKQHGSDTIIPLPNPQGLVDILQSVLEEAKKYNLPIK